MAFRNPVYLDQDLLIPLANYYGISVMREVTLTERRTGGSDVGAGVGVSVFSAKASRVRSTEITESEVISDHPVSALNHLADELAAQGDLRTEFESGVSKGDTVELDLNWELSPLNEVGGILSAMIQYAVQNPSSMAASETPLALVAELMSGSPSGPAVLEADHVDLGRTLVLFDRDYLRVENALDRIEGGATVLGQVEKVVGDGGFYSLEPLLTPGLNRAVRRSLPTHAMDELLEKMEPLLGRPMSTGDLQVDGPAVLIRAVAIY
jgi:hypothetical protein